MERPTFPAERIMWGVPIREGFDELDDPSYHRGFTGHAYLEGHDDIAICGYRPASAGLIGRRRPKLGIPSVSFHPACDRCAQRIAYPRPRVPVPVQVKPAPAVLPVPPRPAPMHSQPAPIHAQPAPMRPLVRAAVPAHR